MVMMIALWACPEEQTLFDLPHEVHQHIWRLTRRLVRDDIGRVISAHLTNRAQWTATPFENGPRPVHFMVNFSLTEQKRMSMVRSFDSSFFDAEYEVTEDAPHVSVRVFETWGRVRVCLYGYTLKDRWLHEASGRWLHTHEDDKYLL